jgi:hypothetical protein
MPLIYPMPDELRRYTDCDFEPWGDIRDRLREQTRVDYAQWYHCDHPSSRQVLEIDRRGVKRYRLQCTVCGRSATGCAAYIKAIEVNRDLPVGAWDHELERCWRDERYAVVQSKQTEARETERRLWRLYYNWYLKTPYWGAKREEVLKLCRGICEKCNLRPVVEIHHMNYDTLGAEGMEDIAGLCGWCHSEAHGKMRR